MKKTNSKVTVKSTDELYELHIAAVKNFLQFCKRSAKAKLFNYMQVYGKLKESYPNVDIVSTGKVLGRKFYTKVIVKHQWFTNYSVDVNTLMTSMVDNYVFIDRNTAYAVTADMLIAAAKQFKENTSENSGSYYLVPVNFIQKHGRKLVM